MPFMHQVHQLLPRNLQFLHHEVERHAEIGDLIDRRHRRALLEIARRNLACDPD
jgi:hypothetical protein